MIQMQIIEQPGAGLHENSSQPSAPGASKPFPQETGKTRDAHDLFNPRLDEVDARGRRHGLLHPSSKSLAWSGSSSARPRSYRGRFADRKIHSINVEFPGEPPATKARRRSERTAAEIFLKVA